MVDDNDTSTSTFYEWNNILNNNSLIDGSFLDTNIIDDVVGNDGSDGSDFIDTDFLTNNSTSSLVETFWKDIYSQNNLQPGLGWKIPQYYSLPYQVIGTIFQGIIFIVGVLGNVMVVIVVLRSRSMRTPTNCYLVSLAVADTMVLLASVPNEIIAYYLLGDKWIWGPIGCALFIFLQYLGINASSLSIAAFTVERYIAICHPMLAHKLCTVRRAKRIIMYVWMFATTYCAPWLFLTKTEQIYYLWIETEVYTCKFKLNREHYKGYFLTDIVLFYILPLLISCILYALIARILYNSNDIIKHQPKPSSSSHQNNPLDESLNMKGNIAECKINMMESKKNISTDSSRVQVVKMLAVIVAVFATLWLPYRALVVYNSFSFPPYMELWYLMFAKTMIFVNSAINPIIYSACSMKFRREFKRMLTCRTRKPKTNYRAYRSDGGASHSLALSVKPRMVAADPSSINQHHNKKQNSNQFSFRSTTTNSNEERSSNQFLNQSSKQQFDRQKSSSNRSIAKNHKLNNTSRNNDANDDEDGDGYRNDSTENDIEAMVHPGHSSSNLTPAQSSVVSDNNLSSNPIRTTASITVYHSDQNDRSCIFRTETIVSNTTSVGSCQEHQF